MTTTPDPSMKVTSGKYIFKYDGDIDYISLNTLLASQMHFSQALTQIKDTIHPDKELEIKVKALPKGSFQIEILANVNYIHHLLTPDAVSYAADIVGLFSGLAALILALKGDKPKDAISGQDDSVNIITGDDSVVTVTKNVYNVYSSRPAVVREMAETFEPIIEDEEIESVTIIDDQTGDAMLSVPRESFDFFTRANSTKLVNTNQEIRRSVNLVVFKVVFEVGSKKWQFYLDGHRISASIHDMSFLSRVERGESFAIGDTLVSDVEIDSEYDERLGIFIPKTYKVLKVHEHINREQSRQGNLFDRPPGAGDDQKV